MKFWLEDKMPVISIKSHEVGAKFLVEAYVWRSKLLGWQWDVLQRSCPSRVWKPPDKTYTLNKVPSF